ncbi:hypothetical protein VPNG_00776 [Cytospora leucostoma]|uniref:Uncharacterized protein n=1 Tax=Cytospora leucostoma TaxID=1230097 RepID=A0A423XM23_9PEZI|nr:hypothetical protein VPNG_00776 [Cytospora leucostoma]
MSDVFLRTGRGGAGNYVSPKEVEEAERAQRAEDPESQKDDTVISRTTTTASTASAWQPSPYVRSGRGGAGNFAEPPTEAAHDTQDVVDRTTAAVSASQAGKPRAGLTGRGGAGNWTGDAERHEFEEEAERQRIAEKIKHDIDASLPPPPKTYHQHDRDME